MGEAIKVLNAIPEDRVDAFSMMSAETYFNIISERSAGKKAIEDVIANQKIRAHQNRHRFVLPDERVIALAKSVIDKKRRTFLGNYFRYHKEMK